MPTTLTNGIQLPDKGSVDWYSSMQSNYNLIDTHLGDTDIHVTTEDKSKWDGKANSADLATVATSGSYNDLSNKPTINDSTITIQKNGSTVDTFTTNGSNKTINIPVPTKTSDLTNDSNFVDTSNSAVASGITSAKVTDYDTHIADTDIHVTSADKTTWNTVTSKADDNNVMHLSGNETVNGVKSFADNIVAQTSINGINPGALSFPDLSAGLDISSYITVNGGNKESLYTPLSNGWISVALTRSGSANMVVMLKQGNFASSGNNILHENGTKTCNAMLPVVGGVQVSINIALADGIYFAYFYPCQGNV